MTQARILLVHALSPLHAGTGQSVGAVELAIARDRATGFPCIYGSSIKGALRSAAEASGGAGVTADQVKRVFGPDTQNAHEYAGALALGDANLLMMPARSWAGTFAWVTSPYLLRRFARDCAEAGVKNVPKVPEPNVATAFAAVASPLVASGQQILLEDLDFAWSAHADAGAWARLLGALLFPQDAEWQDLLAKRFIVVADDVMGFVSQHCTDVVARVKLKDDSKTVDNLWHEESLPTESVLAAFVVGTDINRSNATGAEAISVLDKLTATSVQLGGKSNVGRGRCRLVLVEG